jgi:hypothetical protein
MKVNAITKVAIISLVFWSLITWQVASVQPGKKPRTPASRVDVVMGRQYDEGGVGMKDDQTNHAITRYVAEQRRRTKAEAKITVQSSEAKAYDQSPSPALMELQLNEVFTGDIEGGSPVRALQVLRDDKSASLVSMQRFRGKLGGRQGSFVLQGSEIVESGKIKATWFVVPGSGTGDLSGLRGEGGFEGQFGKGSDGWLEYWFE